MVFLHARKRLGSNREEGRRREKKGGKRSPERTLLFLLGNSEGLMLQDKVNDSKYPVVTTTSAPCSVFSSRDGLVQQRLRELVCFLG